MGLNHISKLWWFTRFEIAVRMDESNSERILQWPLVGEAPAEVKYVDYRKKARFKYPGKCAAKLKGYRNIHRCRTKDSSSPLNTYLVDGQDYHSWSVEFNDEQTVVNTTKVITSSAPRSAVQRTLARVQ